MREAVRPLATPSVPRPRDPFRTATGVVSWAAPLALVSVVVVLLLQALPAMSRFGLAFLTGREWNPVSGHFGALPFIFGTVVTSLLALVIAIPIGVGVAIFLSQPSAAAVRNVIGIGVELLAAIPSVVYGLWALFVMGPFVFKNLETPLNTHLGTLALFSGTPRPTSIFTAGLILSIMVLPTLASISRDVIRAVPGGLREASIALGATWWETTWQVVLPSARAGIVGATVLALGRALGETIAVTLVIGNRPDIQPSLFQPGYTLASVIANEFNEATGTVYTAALVELGLVLILLTLSVNLFALGLVNATVRRRAA